MCKDGMDLRADLAKLEISPRVIDAMVMLAHELSDHFEAGLRDRPSAERHLEAALLVTTNLFALAGAQVRRLARLDEGIDLPLVSRTLAAAAAGVAPCEFLNSECERN